MFLLHLLPLISLQQFIKIKRKKERKVYKWFSLPLSTLHFLFFLFLFNFRGPFILFLSLQNLPLPPFSHFTHFFLSISLSWLFTGKPFLVFSNTTIQYHYPSLFSNSSDPFGFLSLNPQWLLQFLFALFFFFFYL